MCHRTDHHGQDRRINGGGLQSLEADGSISMFNH